MHGIAVIGRVDMNEDEVAANFSFLAMDESSSKDSGLVRKHRSKAEGALDTHNKVFVWGLNDRGQLGSEISETKVRYCRKVVVRYEYMYVINEGLGRDNFELFLVS